MPHPLAERIPPDSVFRVMVDSAFGTVDSFRAKIRDIRSDKRFSDQGHLERIKEAAKTGPMVYFAALKQQIADERKSLERRRSHFELPSPDRDDVVGALNQQEIRQFLRSIQNIGERIKLVASDPTIAKAVVHSPAVLSGLNDEGMKRATEFLTRHLFGDELAILDQEAEVVDNVDAALAVAEAQLIAEIEPARAAA